MKFETAYKMFEVAEVETVEVHFWASVDSYADTQFSWDCRLMELPFFLASLDVYNIECGSHNVIKIFLDSKETNKYWETIKELG